MALAAAAHAGVWYPPTYANGFYGGTRYMPLPILLQAAGRSVGGEYLVSAKLLIYAVNVALYALVFIVVRRRGAPIPVALALVAAILSSSAAATTFFGIRWDSLAILLQLAAVTVVVETSTPRRSALAGFLCALAVLTKLSALWAPAAIVVWLLRSNPRRAPVFLSSLIASTSLGVAGFELLSHGRLVDQLRSFAFAGSTHSSRFEGLHRIYQLVLRNERSLPLFLLLAAIAVLFAVARRTAGPYELGLVFLIPILVVVMRDVGAYENHLIDLEVLAGVAVAGLWPRSVTSRSAAVGRLAISVCLVAAIGAAARYTLIPDARAAFRHELRGRPDPRYSVHPQPRVTAQGTCALFEDASIPVLSGQRPVVLDAFIVHRLQTQDAVALSKLERRIARREFKTIALTFPLTDAGWFATLDFGTALASAMRTHYKFAGTESGFFLYQPRRPAASAIPCSATSLDRWNAG
jgi:hypothetical protein